MKLSASELLDAWESGLAQPPVQRALTLLSAIRPQMPLDDLAGLSIGQRDAGLLSLREETFGSSLVCLADCPGCRERLEVSFNIADLRAPSANPEPATLSLSVEGYRVQFRSPNSFDLFAIADSKDVTEGRDLLLQRCLLLAEHNGEEKAPRELPAGVIAAIVERMAEADPQADVQLAFSCPLCEHRWQAAFDIVSFFWSEINAWAYRTLRDVHALASAYGWHESEILSLGPARRRVYLEMSNR